MNLYKISSILFFFISSSLLKNPLITCLTTSNIRLPSVADDDSHTEIRTYIIHLDKPKRSNRLPLGAEELESWHKSFLPNTTLDSGEPRLVYSYSEVLTGFATKLTAHEVQAMRDMDGFLHAQLDMEVGPMTMYTPSFLGLSAPKNGLWYIESNMGEGMVIGVIDSGIPRNHSSFSDDKMAPKPAKWKGTCTFGNSICNKKIIGVVTFQGGRANLTKPPVDTNGHGSHVASIAAGNFVKNAMFSGNFKYTASGTAPRAHLAIYMIAGAVSDHLKAFDQSIIDGMNIINYSQGFIDKANANFKEDPGALGGYKASQKGIFVAAAVGNSFDKETLCNAAPWLTVVGASTTDKRFGATLRLRNGLEFIGETTQFQKTSFNASVTGTLIYPGNNNKPETLDCKNGSLNVFNVKNKIVLCRTGTRGNVAKGRVVLAAGAAAMILLGSGRYTSNEDHVLPVC
ncbi:Peptidase S8 subtilisin-related protein [Dioscorea alata]|uniref:Peptidase S8 subtilisin-related protein n=1 Tax=Dioscorea alata TaxID=55571 RepID=A0ACB7W2I2_DIOAL|nr:Peptidase S8 subtilisin-related protein [Dioscorea alata]